MIKEIITGSHTVCGIIGNPIKHTLSPMIHNLLAKAYAVPSIYVPFPVENGHLEDAIKGAYALGIKGLNVTMPYKQQLEDLVVEMHESAKQVGAINTLVAKEKGYIGYNTDCLGLQMALQEENIEWEGKNVGIIGSGGAAYATFAAIAKKAKSIHIFNRTPMHAQALVKQMQAYFSTPTNIYSLEEVPAIPLDIVFQTTGLGMGNNKEKMPICSTSLLNDAAVAVDLIYEPMQTVFLQYAKSKGVQTMNGLGMLFYQAVKAFEYMHDIHCETKVLAPIKQEIEDYVSYLWNKKVSRL